MNTIFSKSPQHFTEKSRPESKNLSTTVPLKHTNLSAHFENMYMSLQNTSNFSFHAIKLSSCIPEAMHAYISVEVVSVIINQHFPNSPPLMDVLILHLNSLINHLTSLDSVSEEKMRNSTHYLISAIKQIIQNSIKLSLTPNQVFILLTCTELFQKIQIIPLKLLASAVNHCHEKSSEISSTSSLPSIYSLTCSLSFPFLPEYNHKEFTLILDLDETLGHFDKKEFLLRPYVHEFLFQMSQIYELVLFTAAGREYADWAMQKIDPQGSVLLRLYKDHIDSEIKDLSNLGRNLDKVIIIDNYPKSFEKHPRNGILISSWTGDMRDTALYKLAKLLSTIPFIKKKGLGDLISVINNYMRN